MPKKIEKQTVKPTNSTGKTQGESCKPCGHCKVCSWILPLIIIVLIWWKPTEMWAQIVVTVIGALMILAHLCPCHRK